MNDAINIVQGMIAAHHAEHMSWEFDDEEKRGPEPKPVDFKALALEHNLVAGETALMDEAELAKEPIGKIPVPVRVTMPNGMQQQDFRLIAQLLFSRYEDIKPYDPMKASDFMTSNTNLYWISEKKDAEVPEFEK